MIETTHRTIERLSKTNRAACRCNETLINKGLPIFFHETTDCAHGILDEMVVCSVSFAKPQTTARKLET